MDIQRILVTQPAPKDPQRSPYTSLASKYGLQIDFRPFIQVEPVPPQEFRQERINILEYTAVVFTSRNAVDHYFRMAKGLRVKVPDAMKYFCVSESVAYYIQTYIQYRKRKVFIGRATFGDLMDVIKKHKEEKFLVPCSNILKPEIPQLLNKSGVKYTNAVFYRTVPSDLSDLNDIRYDLLAFFSPADIESLRKNFPDYVQDDAVIAAFGPTTVKAVRAAGYRVDIEAPLPEAPSMSGAIELFLERRKAGKGKAKPAPANKAATTRKAAPQRKAAQAKPAKPAVGKRTAKPGTAIPKKTAEAKKPSVKKKAAPKKAAAARKPSVKKKTEPKKKAGAGKAAAKGTKRSGK